LLELDKSEIVFGVGIVGLQGQLGAEFVRGVRPVLLANVGLAGVVVRLEQGWIGAQCGMECGDGSSVVAYVDP